MWANVFARSADNTGSWNLHLNRFRTETARERDNANEPMRERDGNSANERESFWFSSKSVKCKYCAKKSRFIKKRRQNYWDEDRERERNRSVYWTQKELVCGTTIVSVIVRTRNNVINLFEVYRTSNLNCALLYRMIGRSTRFICFFLIQIFFIKKRILFTRIWLVKRVWHAFSLKLKKRAMDK